MGRGALWWPRAPAAAAAAAGRCRPGMLALRRSCRSRLTPATHAAPPDHSGRMLSRPQMRAAGPAASSRTVPAAAARPVMRAAPRRSLAARVSAEYREADQAAGAKDAKPVRTTRRVGAAGGPIGPDRARRGLRPCAIAP